jgi:hypothetical protein
MRRIPVTPRLEHLCRGKVQLGEVLKAGKLPFGERRIVPIAGGQFKGRLAGEVLLGGADTQWVKPDGTVVLDARYMIKTKDEAIVYIHNHGLRAASLDINERISRGESVDPCSYYFRTTPEFETGDTKYAWLNNVVAVCSGLRLVNSVVLDFYIVL